MAFSNLNNQIRLLSITGVTIDYLVSRITNRVHFYGICSRRPLPEQWINLWLKYYAAFVHMMIVFRFIEHVLFYAREKVDNERQLNFKVFLFLFVPREAV